MKKLLFTAQITFCTAFIFFLLLAVNQLVDSLFSKQNTSYSQTVYDNIEEFDPSLVRLNSISKLKTYCDSLFEIKKATNPSSIKESSYPEIVSAVIRKRFYHGYSIYDLNDNFMAVSLSRMTISGLSSVVVPDDILKYPHAACSQQSIIMMELLNMRGYSTRKVGFSGRITGHFTFEALYDNSWHYFDTDKEPDADYLNAHNRPSIAYLNANPDMLRRAYPQYSTAYVMDVFTNYSYGKIGEFPASKAIVFQYVTKFLSYTLWLFFLVAFVFTRKKYKRYKLASIKSKNERNLPTSVNMGMSPYRPAI